MEIGQVTQYKMEARCIIRKYKKTITINVYKFKTHINFGNWKVTADVIVRNSQFKKTVLNKIKPLLNSLDEETNNLGLIILFNNLKNYNLKDYLK